MTNSVVSHLVTSHTVDDLKTISSILAESGFFDDARTAAQCFVKVLAGQELGITAFAAMTGIHIIKGKPAIGSNLMAGRIKASGKYDYRVKTLTDDLCEIEFFQQGESLGTSSFSKADATKRGTQNMGKFPKNMLFARAMSDGVRFYCPDVFMGLPVYATEEIVEAEVVPSDEQVEASLPARPREWKDLLTWTGFKTPELKAIAQRIGLPDGKLTQEQSDSLRIGLFVEWAMLHYPDVYKHRNHAVNAIAKVEVEDDEQFFLAWVEASEARQPQPALAGDEDSSAEQLE